MLYNKRLPMSKILIAGGTGLIGKRLCPILQEQGYEIALLSRRANPNSAYPIFQWDPIAGQIDETALERVDYVINLAGAGIADKGWSPKRKQLIIDSRVKSNELLINSLERKQKKVKAFVSASAVGYYGDRGEEKLTESSPPGRDGFLSESCVLWEASAQKASNVAERLVIVRIGVVLSLNGGALEKIMLPFRFGMGNYFGDGTAYMPWIHIDDMCHLLVKTIEDSSMSGVYNGVAPQEVTGKALAYAIKQAMGSPALIMPVPSFALRIGMGERVSMLTNSNRVVPERTLAAGYIYRYPELVPAVQDLLKRKI